MNTYKSYKEMKQAHEKMVNDLPLGFAFGQKQFEEMMNKWGLSVTDTDKIYSMGGGGYFLKKDVELVDRVFATISEEEKHFKKDLKLFSQMIETELLNHEYQITGDIEETLDSIGVEWEELSDDQQKQVKKACKNIMARAM